MRVEAEAVFVFVFVFFSVTLVSGSTLSCARLCFCMFLHATDLMPSCACVCLFGLFTHYTSLAWRRLVFVFLSLMFTRICCFFVRTNGDSFYEYLLKMYVLWGDVRYWDMFMQTYVSLQVGELRKERADQREDKARGVLSHAVP